MGKFRFELDKDYYLENGTIVYTDVYLRNRGTCCGSNCRHCCFEPSNTKGNKVLQENYDKEL